MDNNFDAHDTSLVLGLGYASSDHRRRHQNPFKPLEPDGLHLHLPPSLTLALQADAYLTSQLKLMPESNMVMGSSSASPVSSFSKAASDEDEEGSARKKLRLTKQQSALLEDRFRDHTTLNPKQKQALAKQLNLRPRQVEVWFQNRRARNKMKQTEAECEILKRHCERLRDENQRMHRELRELKAFKVHLPLYMQYPAGASLTMCPSCNRVMGGSYNDGLYSPIPPPPPIKPRLLKASTR